MSTNGISSTIKKSKLRVLAAIVLTAVVATLLSTFVSGCTDKKKDNQLPDMAKAENIACLDEIQGKNNLYFEWLNNSFNVTKPTLIVVHGEMTGEGDKKFSMDLDSTEYTVQKESADTDYVVPNKIGYKAEGLRMDISHYWLVESQWNVAIFHWERFVDEDSVDDLTAKLFSVPKMRYISGYEANEETGERTALYETTKVPKMSLTEVFAALYVKEMDGKISGNEIRFAGNGIGADLALSAAHYLSIYSKAGFLEKGYLPSRIALCDPYLSTADLHLADNKLVWADIDTKRGMVSVANDMLTDVAAYGAAIELIESNEISSRNVTDAAGESVTQRVSTFAYEIAQNEQSEATYKKLKEKVAYLELRESYSTKFSDRYKGFKRIALDWYLYSIIGSDDSGNAGGDRAIGYPTSISDFNSYSDYSGFNWAPNMTRPMVNNRKLNSDGSGYTSRGKNYSLSAWTPTVYTRALRGISFKMKKAGSNKLSVDTVHGNSNYTYEDYTLGYFRSENFQVSDLDDCTLVCGYVYLDVNGDKLINDGFNGLGGETLRVSITKGSGSSEIKVADFEVVTDESGFFCIRLEDKIRDSEGNLSESGYAFNTDHTLTLTLIPSSHDYVAMSSSLSGKPFYVSVGGHNFSGFKGEVALRDYYANAVNITNCLVKPAAKD